MSVRARVVERDSLKSRLLSQRHDGRGRSLPGDRARDVRIGEPRPGSGILGLELDRLLKILTALLVISSEPVITPQQVLIMCLGADMGPGSCRGRNGQSDLLGNRPCQFVLQNANIANLAIVAFGPKVRIAGRMDQLNVDMDTVSRAFNRALENCINAEFVCDVRQTLLRPLVL